MSAFVHGRVVSETSDSDGNTGERWGGRESSVLQLKTVLELVGQEPAVLLPQQMCLSGSLEGCVWAVCPSVHGIWGAFTFLCIHITGKKSKQSSLRSMLSQAQKMLSGNSDVPLSKSDLWEAVGQFSFCSDCSKLS